MSLKRYQIYLSKVYDAQLLRELGTCTGRGKKTELIRDFALLGYANALELCASANDYTSLNATLAALFASENSQHDFRQASEFMRVLGITKGPSGSVVRGNQTAPEALVAATGVQETDSEPEVPEKPSGDSLSPPLPDIESVAPAKRWGPLNSLVGKRTQSNSDLGSA